MNSLSHFVRLTLPFYLLISCVSAEAENTDGESLYVVCAACHGVSGEGNQMMSAPKLAGMEPWYLIKQMQLFQIGARGAAPGDMQGMLMAATAKRPDLSEPATLQSIAAYIVSLADKHTAEMTPVTVSGDIQAGASLYRSCAMCHGDQAQGIEAMGGPRLAGQSDWYLVKQLNMFRQGQRGYHNADHGGRQMRPMVSVLAGDKAVNDVVSYISTLP